MGKRSRKRTVGTAAGPAPAAAGGAPKRASSWAAAPAEPKQSRLERAAAREAASARTAGGSPHATRPDRRARLDELPKAPWSPVPLVELVILAGLILVGIGFFDADHRGRLLVTGFLLASAGGLELTVREHLAGFRSHSVLLAGGCAVLVDAGLFLTRLPQTVLLVAGAVTFFVAFQLLRGLFARRAGGLTFRA